MRRILILVFLLGLLPPSFAQSWPIWKRPKSREDSLVWAKKKQEHFKASSLKYWQKGEFKFNHRRQTKKLPLLLGLYPSDSTLWTAQAKDAFLQRHYLKADSLLQIAQNKGYTLQHSDMVIRAMAQHLNGTFDSATLSYRLYFRDIKREPAERITWAKNRLIQAETGTRLVDRRDQLFSTILFNSSPDSLFSPLSYASEKYYYAVDFDAQTKVYQLRRLNYQIQDQKPEKPEGAFALRPLSLSADGQLIILQAYSKKTGADLWYAQKLNGEWSNPVPFPPGVNSTADEISASYSPTLQRLYFSSNRTGGFGGFDLYSADFVPEKGWCNVQNLGQVINTRKHEPFVWCHMDSKTLYFSSYGHASIGGADILFSELRGNQFQAPQNVGYPINTPSDDLHFNLSPDGHFALMQVRPQETNPISKLRLVSMFAQTKEPMLVLVDKSSIHQPKPLMVPIQRKDLCPSCSPVKQWNLKLPEQHLGGMVWIEDDVIQQPLFTLGFGAKDTLLQLALPAERRYKITLLPTGRIPRMFSIDHLYPEGFSKSHHRLPPNDDAGSCLPVRPALEDLPSAILPQVFHVLDHWNQYHPGRTIELSYNQEELSLPLNYLKNQLSRLHPDMQMSIRFSTETPRNCLQLSIPKHEP
ncbi:MAG: hypothetical protein O3C32_05220 [Bacteroidetes bacterium]|nr:hypothetical protein [Bacteroidota bacterium]